MLVRTPPFEANTTTDGGWCAHTRADAGNQIRSDLCEAIYLQWDRIIIASVFGILVVE
jgi:hypothetical protein